MALAQVGPLTAGLEAVANAVGAGVVIGSATAGIVRLMLRRLRREVENAMAFGGIVGGGFGFVVAAMDLCLRYAA